MSAVHAPTPRSLISVARALSSSRSARPSGANSPATIAWASPRMYEAFCRVSPALCKSAFSSAAMRPGLTAPATFSSRVGSAPGGERDLLLEDDLDQRLEAGSAVPEGRRAVARDDGGEVRIPAGELGDALRERPGRQLERHVNLTSSGGLV